MTVEVKIPEAGESVQEVQIAQWFKSEGEEVDQDEDLVELESEKASMELPSPAAGVLTQILKSNGETAEVGETIAHIETEEKPPKEEEQKKGRRKRGEQRKKRAREEETEREAPEEEPARAERNKAEEEEIPATPSARRELRKHGLTAEEVEPSGKRVRRKDVQRYVAQQREREAEEGDRGEGAKRDGKREREEHRRAGAEKPRPPRSMFAPPAAPAAAEDLEEVVPMSAIRQRIARRLVAAQQNAALLTTFNEIDMSEVIALRKRYRDAFSEKYGVRLGFMSFFVKAAVDALKRFPEVNAEVRGEQIVYRNYFHIGIAVGSSRGLVVPVLRFAERMSFGEIEYAIGDFANRAETGELEPDELQGGTFTITNGGVYGSLLSTPLVNPPQSGVLGMHAIDERPVARQGEVVIRPMMYVALTYDHRIIDGRQAVTFLRRIKEAVEDPSRMLIEA